MPELSTPILVVGGGTGGFAAALAIARAGGSCIVTEPTDWLGGQLTVQAVPPDENRWIEGTDKSAPGFFGATDSYLEFRKRVREIYRETRPLTEAARNNPRLNPGNGWVSHLCCEPRVAVESLMQMIAPHIAAGRVRVLYRVEPVAADVDGDRVRSVTIKHLDTGERTTIAADYIIDATELGDLFPLAGLEYNVGAEHTSQYGEIHARADHADPKDVQAISWCFAVEHREGEDHTIDKPASYGFWKNYIPDLDKPWPGKLLSWTVVGGDKHTAREFPFRPYPQQPAENELEMWRYRRIVDTTIYEADQRAAHPDVALINMVQMDYFQRTILDVDAAEQARAFAESREQSLSFLYWMQSEAQRFDGSGKLGFPGLKLRGDELGTTDGFAKAPYIRESRRLKARTVIHEGHVGTDQRKQEKRPQTTAVPWGLAEAFSDSVGIGHYRLDLHPSTAMRNSIYVHTAPFRIPMGALIPQRVKNVLAGAKNIGVTHITNGCYRLHPVEWNSGESAGLLAQYCIANGLTPHAIHEDIVKVRAFQKFVVGQGVKIAWPWEAGAGLS